MDGIRDEGKASAISGALLAWYDRHARRMPWRGIHDPYGTWVSEIMLQQTRVETVRDYYPRFMARFPTVRDLAEAPEADVLKMWEGLGYYSRARNLQAGARQVLAEYGGVLPREPERLRKIRGIGPYTACAIASIAYGVPVPAVDGNVIRVVSRLYALTGNPLAAPLRDRIEELAAEMVPAERPGDHNQAMMDLGATVCVPGTPDCGLCPLAGLCRARAEGMAEELPQLPAARPPKEIQYDLAILFSGDRTLMYRRSESILRGLWCFPLLEGRREGEELAGAIRRRARTEISDLTFAGEAKHVFTHRVWWMRIYTCRAPAEAPAPPGFRWVTLAEMEALALPTAMRRAREIAAAWMPEKSEI